MLSVCEVGLVGKLDVAVVSVRRPCCDYCVHGGRFALSEPRLRLPSPIFDSDSRRCNQPGLFILSIISRRINTCILSVFSRQDFYVFLQDKIDKIILHLYVKGSVYFVIRVFFSDLHCIRELFSNSLISFPDFSSFQPLHPSA